jgi:N,N-dimethylformamidase beta subunit-like, C-terminal
VDLIRTTTAALLVALGCVGGSGAEQGRSDSAEGRAERLAPTNRPTIEAAFTQESYAAGDVARLVTWTRGARVTLQLFRAGTETTRIKARDVMLGTAVTPPRQIGAATPGGVIPVRIGDWPSGLYFAKLRGTDDKVGYAPFVVRPRHLGEAPVAVVFSTMTWQAYNFHDDDRNGTLDTW